MLCISLIATSLSMIGPAEEWYKPVSLSPLLWKKNKCLSQKIPNPSAS